MGDQPLALIIEDEAGLAIMYEHVLSGLGYSVLKANNGEAAIAHLQDNTPIFIMSDMRLPGIGGPDIMNYIANEPRFDQTFVLVVSSGKEYETSIAPLKNARFIVKPILINQIIEIAQPLITAPEAG